MYYILLGFVVCCSGVVSAYSGSFNYHFNRTVYDPNKTENCSVRSEDFKKAAKGNICHPLSVWRRNHSHEYCADYWFYNERTFIWGHKISAERASVQYCNGTSDFIPCVECFNMATEPLWDERRCAEYNLSVPVTECFRKYNNQAFNWSREVILNGASVTKYISLETPPYSKCFHHFEEMEIEEDFSVKFPISFPFRPDDFSSILNVMLSFYLNAFEDNNPDGKTTRHPYGFRCEDFQFAGYLGQYCSWIDYYGFPLSNTVKNFYKKLRADMCMNETQCTSCFSKTDTKFFESIMNLNPRSLVSEYDQMSMMYHSCLQTYNISQEYVAILNDSHTGMEKLNVSSCANLIKNMYNLLIQNPNYLKTNNHTRNKAFLEVTAVNLYSSFAYAAKWPQDETCELIENSMMACFLKNTVDLMDNTEGNITRREEDEALGRFGFDGAYCDMYND